MRGTKIVLIGAGSAVFGLGTVRDIIKERQSLKGSTIALVDVDAGKLDTVRRLTARMNEQAGAGLRIEATTDRREALEGADFVVVSVAVNREELWRKDFQVPLKYGIDHVLGENGGPGALFHSMRNIPMILDICRDMERVCPDALLLNFTNPMSRVCLAVSRHTRIRAVGLCHQIRVGYRIVSRIMEIPPEEFQITAGGINHFTWILELRAKGSKKDLYPLFKQRLSGYDPAYQPLSRFLCDTFGLFPATGDGHAGEYVAFAGEMIGTKGYDFEAAERDRDTMWERLGRVLDGQEDPAPLVESFSQEQVVSIICGILNNTNHYELAVNIPNDGHISNLPRGAIVEVPAVVNASGVSGVHVGGLPEGIAHLCAMQAMIQDLVVEAAVTGDRAVALQALLLDPLVKSASVARKILDELLEAEKPYLPQFR